VRCFFIKPGYARAYDLLQVKTYPLESNISVQTDPSWLELRLVKTVLGDHLLVRTAGGWLNLDPHSLRPKDQPSAEQIRELITDATSGNPRYGRITGIDASRITTDHRVRIELDWNRLSLAQRGTDTDRRMPSTRFTTCNGTGLKNVDKVLGAIGILLVLGLSLLGALLFFKG
jgi:hypothetical protein